MIRTQISLTEDQMRRAKRCAARRGISLAALIREALDRALDTDADQRRRHIASEAVGGYRSGWSGVSVEHDEVLAEPDW
jgi:hypothetical protein